jgi:mono-ADP-ribosyltransferase sirtuin 6
MSKDYNSRLKPISYKGLCGDPEITESSAALQKKVRELAKLVQNSSRTVIFTGAGISTSCGIPDFRGPNGVWTKEQRGLSYLQEEQHNTFDSARPSLTHYAIACLVHARVFAHIVSQNVDGLHLRSGIPEDQLSELHGNIFKERCEACGREYLRPHDVGGMGLKYTGNACEEPNCTGKLRDMAVDWDTELPKSIFHKAHTEMDRADLVICLGSSLRIRPAGNMPLRVVTPKIARGGRVGKLCIVNLQKTHLDSKAAVRISHYCDEVMQSLCEVLGLRLKPLDELHSCSAVGEMYTIDDGFSRQSHGKNGVGKNSFEEKTADVETQRKNCVQDATVCRKRKSPESSSLEDDKSRETSLKPGKDAAEASSRSGRTHGEEQPTVVTSEKDDLYW